MAQRICVGVATFPLLESGVIPLSNLLDVLNPLSDNIYVITGNSGVALAEKHKGANFHPVNHKTGRNTFTRIANYIWAQISISFKLAKLSSKVDVWLFFLGENGLLLPMLTAKLFRKQVILCLASYDVRVSRAQQDSLSVPLTLVSRINLALSNRIILYSEKLVEEWNLKKYRHKIAVGHQHFLDFDNFKKLKFLEKRDSLVGYVGRLSSEKGVLDFVRAVPIVLETRPEIEFYIGGDGHLRGEIEQYIDNNVLRDKIHFVGWIPHNELPEYLNNLKLLVLPSYTEGLPGILLETMACGTLVLATSVGGIPDVVKDGETGFILDNNSPECIAENIIRVLNYPNLEAIATNARALMEREFSYEKALGNYRSILASWTQLT